MPEITSPRSACACAGTTAAKLVIPARLAANKTGRVKFRTEFNMVYNLSRAQTELARPSQRL
jgi:hypothetical protein